MRVRSGLLQGVVLSAVALSAAAIAAAALPAAARADEQVALRGQVVGPDGEPLEGLHVMLVEGRKRLPPFMIRPQAFGLPLPNVRVVKTGERGAFEIPRVKPGTKTLAFGEEGLLLFGRAALRRVEAGSGREPVRIQLTEEEMEAYASLADRAERATEVIEEVLIEVDTALGWYVEARTHLDAHLAEARAMLGLDDEGQEEQRLQPKASSRLPDAWAKVKSRVEELMK